MRTILLALAIAMAAPMMAVADDFDFSPDAMACAGTAPILVVTDRAYNNAYHRDPAEVIETALNRRLYHITARGPGRIEAFYAARDVRADIVVTYTDSTYSIEYGDSQGLRYGNGRIDSHYNHWVNNLDSDLQIEFAAPSPATAAPAQ